MTLSKIHLPPRCYRNASRRFRSFPARSTRSPRSLSVYDSNVWTRSEEALIHAVLANGLKTARPRCLILFMDCELEPSQMTSLSTSTAGAHPCVTSEATVGDLECRGGITVDRAPSILRSSYAVKWLCREHSDVNSPPSYVWGYSTTLYTYTDRLDGTQVYDLQSASVGCLWVNLPPG
jgi:hypothetical protein